MGYYFCSVGRLTGAVNRQQVAGERKLTWQGKVRGLNPLTVGSLRDTYNFYVQTIPHIAKYTLLWVSTKP